jgi:predicted kinase
MNLELIVLMGLQAAGKTSFYRHFFEKTHEIVSKDLMKNRKAKSILQEKLIRQILASNKSVVVDNTNMTFKNREELISLAKHFGAKTILYYFPLTVAESLIRNKGINRNEVPPVAIYSAAKNLDPPGPSEGFDEVYLVRMELKDKFHVERLFKE